ncbi:MAG: hypothetical protein JO263_00350 [Candidatus Eremiobacteraeota bacterium]|nr:hypothetical protein [Candidatus Eremiobacteraeota bacterium]
MIVRIYHTSDLHDRRGIVTRLRELREQQPGLLFDCGDSLRGSQTVYFRNEPIMDELAAAGYDAQAIGNREFHYLFGLMRARASRLRHRLVCTNLLDTKNRRLPFSRSLRFEIGRDDGSPLEIHVLGLLVMQYPTGSPWERLFGWRFLQPWDAVNQYVAGLSGDAFVVVLSHLGLSLDRRLAEGVPRIDLILGGHSHDTLDAPQFVAGVPIVHAGPYGRYVSRTQFAQTRGSDGRFPVLDFGLLPLLAPA